MLNLDYSPPHIHLPTLPPAKDEFALSPRDGSIVDINFIHEFKKSNFSN